MRSAAESRRTRRRRGLGLVEMLVALGLVALFATLATEIFAGMLRAQTTIDDELAVHPEAQRVLQEIVEAVAFTPHLQVPNGRQREAAVLVVSAGMDADGDGRRDEDPGAAAWDAAGRGVPGIDDDGDGATDEGLLGDDDEDGTVDEDPRNGTDDDGDGSIDEDPGADASADGRAGWAAHDDDGDAATDEGATADDDEDGTADEDGWDAHAWRLDKTTRRLYETRPGAAEFVRLERVGDFRVRYLTGALGEPLLEITLEIEAQGTSRPLRLETRVYPTNQVAVHGSTFP